MESTCYLLIDEKGKETALFSGDTLFIGDVGRPAIFRAALAEETLQVDMRLAVVFAVNVVSKVRDC